MTKYEVPNVVEITWRDGRFKFMREIEDGRISEELHSDGQGAHCKTNWLF